MGQTVATNKKAFRDFTILEKWECGISLKGSEVKSIRAGNVSFKDSFARFEGDEILLHNLYINPYVEASYLNDEPDRVRKLLLHKKEIKKIIALVSQKNLTLVPTKIYFNNRGFVKIEIALGKGKKLYDKRETIKARETDLAIKRAVRARRR